VSDKRVDKRIVNNEKLKPSGVVAKLLQGGRFEAPNSDGMVCLYAEPFRKTDLMVLINGLAIALEHHGGSYSKLIIIYTC
jgi:hypothetical protein